jgi:lipopolysaccharide export system permease protein
MDPAIALCFSSLLLLPLGIFLTYKATTDSPLLDADVWKRIFKLMLLKSDNKTN